MSSLKDRQRAAARAKLERLMAERQAAAERRRRIRNSALAFAGVLVVVGAAVWVTLALTGGKKSPAASASPGASATATANGSPGPCAWTPVTAAQNPKIKDVGTPPATGEPRSGTSTMTIGTNLGAIKVEMDLVHAPCTSESFAYLAGKKFFDNTTCHRLTTQGIYVLQCGDPTASGQGGPAYQFKNENLPVNRTPAYPAGTVAMANTGQDGTNGSQFFIVYKDTDLPADYTVFGKVTQGLDLVQKVAAAGVTPADPSNPGDGKPKLEVSIKTLTVSAPVPAGTPAPGGSPSPTAAAPPSGTASPKP